MSYDRNYAQQVLGARCDECPLRTDSVFVPSTGPDTAEVAFVGEAPGVQEARSGIPFVGPSGRLLDVVNTQYGIKRSEVFLTNACLCRPDDNSNPTNVAVQACRPRLHRELRERGSRTVVTLGNKASLSVLGVEGVTKLRVGPGRRSPYEDLKDIRIIPTIHPAACLRQSDMFPSLVADVGKVVTPHVPWVEPDIRIVDDPVDAIAELRALELRASDLVVDIEVDIEKDTSHDHPDRYGLLCNGLAWEPGKALVIGEHASADEGVRDALADALGASRIVAQNGKFDLAGLYPVLGPLQLWFDTMLASYCLDERPGIHGLKQLAVELLGAPHYDEDIAKYVKGRTEEELEDYSGYGRIPRDILYKYNGYDCAVTFAIHELFKKRLATVKPDWWDDSYPMPYEYKSLRELHDFLVEASNEIMYLELNGITVDRPYSNVLTDQYMESLGKIESDIDNILIGGGYKGINPRSVPQVKAALKHFRILTESTDEEHLNMILEKTDEGTPRHEFCKTLLVHRREQKMYGTYVKGTIKRMYRGRVYPTFRIHGTTTGRLACRNPNLQNVPRESSIKQLFVPAREGNVFVQADYAQAELRVLSWLAGDEYFRGILNDPDRDLFDELTPILYPTLPAKLEVDPGLWKDIRVRVKAFVYGLNYGREYFSIAQEYKMEEREARAVRDRFFDAIPEIVRFQRWVKGEINAGHDLINPFGRHRRFHLITKENRKDAEKEALAFLPQSTSSDVCLRAMVRVRRDLRGSGAFIRNIVHDSILVDCPADMATDVSQLLDRRMVESGQELVGDYVEFRTDVKVGKHWGEV